MVAKSVTGKVLAEPINLDTEFCAPPLVVVIVNSDIENLKLEMYGQSNFEKGFLPNNKFDAHYLFFHVK